MTPILTAHGVEKSFPVSRSDREQVRVLHKVDLEVAAGEFVAIVGRSGSGKSTLLYCLSGLVPVDAGTIVLAGRHVDSASRTERARLRRDHVGFIFQDLNLLGALTVRDNVLLPAKLAHTGANRKDVAAALDHVGLGGKARAYPDELSGGEQQRVAIARAILRRPSTLFADEPTGSLDVDTTARVMTLLRDGIGDDTALIMATHDLDIAASANRVIILDHGTARTVLHRPTPGQIFDALHATERKII